MRAPLTRVRLAGAVIRAMRSPVTSTSARRGAAPVPSTSMTSRNSVAGAAAAAAGIAMVLARALPMS
jgi:hypothetical protein